MCWRVMRRAQACCRAERVSHLVSWGWIPIKVVVIVRVLSIVRVTVVKPHLHFAGGHEL